MSLSILERRVLDEIETRGRCEVEESERAHRAQPDPTKNLLCSGFVRCLIRRDPSLVKIGRPISLRGFFILGDLDLTNVKTDVPIEFDDCEFVRSLKTLRDGGDAADLIIDHGRLRSLSLTGTRLGLLSARITGFAGYVKLDSKYKNVKGELGETRFTARRGADLIGCRIDGDLLCNGGLFGVDDAPETTDHQRSPSARPRYALILDRSKLGASVFLSRGFDAKGRVRLVGATIANDLVCSGGTFRATPGEPVRQGSANTALDLPDTRIGGVLYLGPCPQEGGITSPMTEREVEIFGTLNLQGAYSAELRDSEKSWPRKETGTEKRAPPPHIVLDGFRFERLAPGSDTRFGHRKRWLAMRPPSKHTFEPQPIEHLAAHFRATGHEPIARRLYELKGARRQHYRILHHLWHGHRLDWERVTKVPPERQLNPAWFVLRAIWRSTWGLGTALATTVLFYLFTANGYARKRLFFWLFLLWLVGGTTHQYLWEKEMIAPSSPVLYLSEAVAKACGDPFGKVRWYRCQNLPDAQKIAELPTFDPWIYSADLMLPFISLGQKQDWTYKDQSREWETTRFSRPLKLASWGAAAWKWICDVAGVGMGWALVGHRDASGSIIPLWPAKPALIEVTTKIDRTSGGTTWTVRLSEVLPRALVATQTMLGWALSALLIAVLSGLMRSD